MKFSKEDKSIPSASTTLGYIFLRERLSKKPHSADWVKVCQARNQSYYEQSIPAVQGGYFKHQQLPMKVFGNKGDRAEEMYSELQGGQGQ